MIKEVKVEVDQSDDVKSPADLALELNYFVRQRKNGKFFGVPKEYIYIKSSQPSDSSKIDRWLREKIGEEPSIYDSLKTNTSATAMEDYLKYKKGYTQAKVKIKEETQSKRTKIKYHVSPGLRLKVNSTEYFSRDTAVQRELDLIKNESFVRAGEGFDADLIEAEKGRLVNHLQNKGYIDFAANYIVINGDTTIAKNKIDLIFEVLQANKKRKHQSYKIGNINVYTDHYYKQDTFDMYHENVDGIRFYKEQSTYIVDPKVIAKTIYFKPDDLVTREGKLRTYNKLSTLNAYRFAEIQTTKDPKDSSLVHYQIELTPWDNKWTHDSGLDIFNSSIIRSSVQGNRLNLVGFGLSTLLENRNLFGGSERYQINAEVGTQLELSNKNIFRAFNYSLNNTLTYPVFKDPLHIISGLNKVFLQDRIYTAIEREASSNIGLGINSVNFRDQYNITSLNASFGYSSTDRISRNILFDQAGINLNYYDIKDSFLQVFDSNPYLQKTFVDNIFTGFLFKNINYTFSGQPSKKGLSHAFIFNLEFSGLEIGAINGIYNLLSKKKDEWTIGNIDLSKFIRIEFDGRLTKKYSNNTSLVSRFNLGLITPLTPNQASPYVKQFNVGGPNSLRAWAPRGLGLGGSTLFKPNKGEVPYAQGDLKLEANLEYRFPIYYIFEGAVFTDVGNIWALSGYQQDFAARFTSRFYNQLAIAAGYGIRLDFDYFNIRFDFGYRIKEPNKLNGSYWYTPKKVLAQGLGNIQVAVNYPF